MIRLIISILGFGIAGGVFMFYTKPAYDQIRALNLEIAQYDQALERADELQQLKQQLLSRYNAFNPVDIDRLHKLLPDHVDNVRLVLDIDNLASKHKLAIQNVVIGRADAENNQQASAIVGGDTKPYDSLTLKFATQGTYQDFVTFMRDLETSLRIVDLVALSMSATEIANTSQTEPVYGFDVTIRTYWLK